MRERERERERERGIEEGGKRGRERGVYEREREEGGLCTCYY